MISERGNSKRYDQDSLSSKPQALKPPQSLASGTLVSEPADIGHGTLTVDNGTERDAVIKVLDEQNTRIVVAFYVRGGTKASIHKLPDGNFRVFYALGKDWDSTGKTFTRDKAFGRFENELNFVTTERIQDNCDIENMLSIA